MKVKKNKPTIALVTKRQGRIMSCDPEGCKMCEPPSGPGFYQGCTPDCLIECVPAAGPGCIRK